MCNRLLEAKLLHLCMSFGVFGWGSPCCYHFPHRYRAFALCSQACSSAGLGLVCCLEDHILHQEKVFLPGMNPAPSSAQPANTRSRAAHPRVLSPPAAGPRSEAVFLESQSHYLVENEQGWSYLAFLRWEGFWLNRRGMETWSRAKSSFGLIGAGSRIL